MEWLLLFAVIAIVLLLGFAIGKTEKQEETSVNEEPEIMVHGEPTPTGTVLDLVALSLYGYGSLAENAPINPPYSFFFFIVKYKNTKNKVHYALGVSRGFEDIRIVKNSYYDQVSDFTSERIERLIKPFDMFVDDISFNKLVCNYREGAIQEIIKKL